MKKENNSIIDSKRYSDEVDTDEFLNSRRKKILAKILTDEKNIQDLDYVLKAVRALLNINNDIWNKCKAFSVSQDTKSEKINFIVMRRVIYEDVKVKKFGRTLIVTSRKKLNLRDFGKLPSVPKKMTDLIYIHPNEANIFPDYNAYLDRSTILCKELLIPFLVAFQEHLKDIQVYLGEIESWLIQSERVTKYLNDLFDCNHAENEFKGTGEPDLSLTMLFQSKNLLESGKMDWGFRLRSKGDRKKLESLVPFLKVNDPVPVCAIEIQNAGSEIINGVYTLDGKHNEVNKYSRSVYWDGNSARASLYRHTGNSWFLSIHPLNESPGTAEDVDFYRSEGDDEIPPVNGWDTFRKGQEPLPQFFERGEEEEEEDL